MTNEKINVTPIKAKINALAASGKNVFENLLTWACQECGKKFRSVAAAERASRNGCPKCGGCDIDIG